MEFEAHLKLFFPSIFKVALCPCTARWQFILLYIFYIFFEDTIPFYASLREDAESISVKEDFFWSTLGEDISDPQHLSLMLQHRVFLLPRQFFVWTFWISCRRWVSRFCSNYVRIKSSKAAKILAHDFRHFILVLDFCMKNCIPKFRRWLKNRFVIFDTFRCSRKRRGTFRDSDRNWRRFELFLLLVIRCKWILIIFWYFIFRWAPKIIILRLGFKDANGFFIARKNTITYGGGGTCGSSWGCLDFFGSSIPSCLNGSAGSAAQKFISQFQNYFFTIIIELSGTLYLYIGFV